MSSKKKRITLDNVIPMLEQAVQTRGENYRYPDHHAFCRYGEYSHDHRIGKDVLKPLCLIGVLIYQQGGEEALREAVEDGGPITYCEVGSMSFDSDARDVLAKAQRAQDQGHTWGQALRQARLMAADISAEVINQDE